VNIRSAHAPPDRFVSNPPNLLYVLLGSSTSTTKMLITDSASAVITINNLNDPFETSLTIAKICSLGCPPLHELIQAYLTQSRQARLVADVELRTKGPAYARAIANCPLITGDKVHLSNANQRLRGKVRDRYMGASALALVTTDRQSGFDRQLAIVPCKGAVLNLTSAWWFAQTQHLIKNHVICTPHPNVMIVKKCAPFPIEFVVR
jgi:hypothetical protein